MKSPKLLTRNSKSQFGFTLVEVLVVMAIIGILSTILIGYSRKSTRNLILTSTEAKLLSMVSRAKFLSVETFFEQLDNPPGERRICGYGVHVDYENGEIFIFQDRVTGNDCSGASNRYESDLGSEDARLEGELNFVRIDKNVLVLDESSDESLYDVVFIPPDPDVVINGNDTINRGTISVGLDDESFSFTMVVNDAGQVRTE